MFKFLTFLLTAPVNLTIVATITISNNLKEKENIPKEETPQWIWGSPSNQIGFRLRLFFANSLTISRG